jgi:hypothetical protein
LLQSGSSSGPVTQEQIQNQVNQDRQTGEQLQESNEQKQYNMEKSGAPASEVQNAVNQGRQQQEQAQEQREQQEYQLEQQYRNQNNNNNNQQSSSNNNNNSNQQSSSNNNSNQQSSSNNNNNQQSSSNNNNNQQSSSNSAASSQGRKMLQSPSGPVTQQQIQDKVSQFIDSADATSVIPLQICTSHWTAQSLKLESRSQSFLARRHCNEC